MNDVSVATRPARTDALTSLTISEAARLIAAKKLSPVELTEAHLAAIEALNGEEEACMKVNPNYIWS